MGKSNEQSEVYDLRMAVAEQLTLPPAPQYQEETAEGFWQRAEKAGLLLQALELYDQLAQEQAEERGVKRETKKEFEARIEREGRQEKAEQLRAHFEAMGLSQREIQEELVLHLQPMDGTKTRAWVTPDPWECGRMFRTKERQNELLDLVVDWDHKDEVEWAQSKIERARRRQEERQALRAARRRAYELRTQVSVAGAQ